MKIKSIYFFILLFSIATISCKKGEGLGGKATITGKVFVKSYNSTGSLVLKEYYGLDEDVYIVYGDNDYYDDKIATHFDGSYKFEYLMPGTYTIYTYSKDVTGNNTNPKIVLKKEVTITDKKEVVELDDFIIDDN